MLAHGFFYAFICIAVAGLGAFVYGMFQIDPGKAEVGETRDELVPTSTRKKMSSGAKQKIWARTRGFSFQYSDSAEAGHLFSGLKARDPRAIEFALRVGGFTAFVLSTFLAIGTGLIASGEDGGWVFIAFIALFMIRGYFNLKSPEKKPGS